MQLLLLDLLYSKKKPGHLTRPPPALWVCLTRQRRERVQIITSILQQVEGVRPLDSYSHSRENILMADCDENLS